MQVDNDNSNNPASENTQKANVADDKLKSALSNLSRVAEENVSGILETLEGRVKETFASLSQSALDSVKGLKEEFNIAESIRKEPLNWVVGALAAGALFELASTRIAHRPGPIQSQAPRMKGLGPTTQLDQARRYFSAARSGGLGALAVEVGLGYLVRHLVGKFTHGHSDEHGDIPAETAQLH